MVGLGTERNNIMSDFKYVTKKEYQPIKNELIEFEKNFPYKEKESFVVAWNTFNSTIDYRNKKLYLARKQINNGLYQPKVCCTFKNMPRYVVEIELIERNGLYFAIKY